MYIYIIYMCMYICVYIYKTPTIFCKYLENWTRPTITRIEKNCSNLDFYNILKNYWNRGEGNDSTNSLKY